MCNFLKVFTLNIVPKVALTYLSICVGYFEKCHFLINIYFGYLRFGQLFPVCVLFIKLQFVFVFPSLDSKQRGKVLHTRIEFKSHGTRKSVAKVADAINLPIHIVQVNVALERGGWT